MWDFTVVPKCGSSLSRPADPYAVELEICSFLRDTLSFDDVVLRAAIECIAASHGCSVSWSLL